MNAKISVDNTNGKDFTGITIIRKNKNYYIIDYCIAIDISELLN